VLRRQDARLLSAALARRQELQLLRYQYITYPQPCKDYPRRCAKSSSLSG